MTVKDISLASVKLQLSSSAIDPVFVTKTPVLSKGHISDKREEIRRYFHNTYSLYESLFECLTSDESFYTRANPLRQPLIFYYGHTSVFFINKLNATGLINERVDPELESILAVGVDEMSWDDLNEQQYDWPTPQKVKAHRDATRQIIDNFIQDAPCTIPLKWQDPLWLILMGIEHERIHLETSSVLIRELPLHLVRSHHLWGKICADPGQSFEKNNFLPVDGGLVNMGKSRDNPLYGWDNEYGSYSEEVKPFKASQFLVSNAEFKHFVDVDGYKQRKYWTEEGWNWVTYRQAEFPVYWRREKGSKNNYTLRTMLEEIEMPWGWPVEVNYLEAKAFCNWKSELTGEHIRLPMESEWYKLRERVGPDQPYWSKAPGNINLESFMSPCPVTHHEFKDGFYDLIGNVWQWTETAIDGFDGFQVHPSYDDFSTPTFDGKHNVFKGGSWISTGNYAIKDSRYAFRRHFFQHSGFRFVQAQPMAEKKANMYEADHMVACYIEFHYGKPNLGVDNFPVRCIQELANLLEDGPRTKALDIGCATGRSSFELAKLFDAVDAVDFSVRLIEAPTKLQQAGKQRYMVQDEGEISSYREVRLCDFEGYEDIKDKITFCQGDACNLTAKYTNYDAVFAGNLLDRLYDPAKFLKSIKSRIRQRGLLVLTSPYTWLEEHTPRESWVGGFKAKTGENFTTLEGLREELSPEFELVGEPLDVPFVIRETRRKFQYTFAQFTAWRKVSA